MKREELIAQVKQEYADIASSESQQSSIQATTDFTPEAYYENLLNAVITEIQKGTFDHCNSGVEIVNTVANDKSILSEWQ